MIYNRIYIPERDYSKIWNVNSGECSSESPQLERIMQKKYYPEVLDMDAITTLSGYFTGATPVCDAAECAYHVQGVMMKNFIPHDHVGVGCGPYSSLSAPESLEKLKECCGSQGEGVRGFTIPMDLVVKILQVVQEVINAFSK